MFNLFGKSKKSRDKTDAIAACAAPEVSVQKLVERFHSESALCTDVDRRRLLQSAAGVTEEHLALRHVAINTREGAASTCMHLKELRKQSVEVRASQELFRREASNAEATLAAQDLAVRGLRDDSVAAAERKLASLSTMTDHVTTATEVLGSNMRALSRQRPNKRRSFFRHVGEEEGAEARAAVEALQATMARAQQKTRCLEREQEQWDAEWAEMYEQLAIVEARARDIAALQASIAT